VAVAALFLSSKTYAAALTSVTVIPWSSDVSVSGKHTIPFITATSIPNNGKIVITYPAGFTVLGATFDSWSGFDGGQSINVSGQVITITRDGTGTASAAGAKNIILNNITNQATTGSTYTGTVETRDSSNATLDGPTTSANFSITVTTDGLDTTAPWPKAFADSGNTNRSQYSFGYPALKFIITDICEFQTDPIVGADGTIFLAGDPASCPGTHTALSAFDGTTGALKWRSNTSGSMVFAYWKRPTLSRDGGIYVADSTTLYKFAQSDGTQLWTYASGTTSIGGLAIGSDGSLWFSAADKKIHAVNSDGTAKCATSAFSVVPNIQSIASNGTVYAPGPLNSITVISPDCSVQSTFTTSFTSGYSTLALDSSNNIYIGARTALGSDNMRIVKLNSSGSIQWTATSSGVYSFSNSKPPALFSDGSTAIIDNTYINLFNPSGSLVTAYAHGGIDCCGAQPPSFDASGNVMVLVGNGDFPALP